ncbi:alpha/beta fold hydrolase [Gordonia sp. CPCC 205333]|uniref:alpha/beta fold hydrolase n=1 Tax=Gordonia sp. CPCC 205333 TaxID=3140790 RepID=UPI003AF3EC22
MSRQIVRTDDSAELSVEVFGSSFAPTTVVFTHGWTLAGRLWDDVVAGLHRDLGDDIRTVTYDARGHGLSTSGPAGSATLPRLAADLKSVIEVCAPSGDLVLVGHSLGGMTLMALAENWPRLLAERVVGAVFACTSSGKIWAPVKYVPGFIAASPWVLRLNRPKMMRSTSLTRLGMRFGLYGGKASRSHLEDTIEQMRLADPGVVADLGKALLLHERDHVLPYFDSIPTVVLTGANDHLTPARHGRRIAESIDGALLIDEPGAGHMVPHERSSVVVREVGVLVRSGNAAARTLRAIPA